VVIYYAARVDSQDAVELGKLVGETRPNHTVVMFESKAAAASVLSHSRSSVDKSAPIPSSNPKTMRELFGLTQTELSQTLGVSLRTVQNWERAGVAGKRRQFDDLEELSMVLKRTIKRSDIPLWLRSENDAFRGRRPIELLKEGKSRDIIVEFRRLQSGEPV
jgi:DNA-binding transcriptional regulator YiaG